MLENLKRIMKSSLNKFFTVLFLSILIVSTVHCGAAGGSPPIDIPTPVSHLSISSPNKDGMVLVTGEAGFADGNTAYTISNLAPSNSIANSIVNLIISTAWAQSVVSGTTNADGSFQTEIGGSSGDSLQVTSISGGAQIDVSASVPQNQPQVATNFTIQDVVIDPNTNEAFIIGNDGVDGVVFVLNLSTGQVTDSLTLVGASGVFSAAIDIDNNHALVIDSTNNTIRHIHPDTLSVQSTTAILLPVDIATGASGNYVIITHNDTSTAVSFFNTSTDSVTATAGATGDDGETLQMCSLVDTGSDGTNDLAAVICLMSDDEFHLIIYTIDPSTPSVTQTQDIELTGVTPGGLVLFNSASEVLVTDQNSDKVLRIVLADEATIEITVGNGPQGITVNNPDNKAFVVNATDRNLSIIDLSDNSTSFFSDVLGLDPTRISMDRDTASSTGVVVNRGDGTVVLVDQTCLFNIPHS